MRRFKNESGYTLIELMIVLVIIGFLTVILVADSDGNTKANRFSNEVREFTNIIREANTKSYTVNIGTAVSGGCPGDPSGRTFWRGNVLDFDAKATSFNLMLLYGCDVSVFGNKDQRVGIAGKQLQTTYSLPNMGLSISQIDWGSGSTCNQTSATCQASMAFLAPDGRGHTVFSILPFPGPSFCGTCGPYTSDNPIVIRLKDSAIPTLTGIVTIDPVSGKIESTVQ